MSRYVDISELEIPNDECSYEELESFVEAVCESEYIDIVHCRECKHWLDGSGLCKHWSKLYGSVLTKADDFCSYGSRSEKPNNSKERSE